MKNTIVQIPDSYIINDNLLAVSLLNDNDECMGFYMYPIVQIKDDTAHRLYHIALMPDCKYFMPIVSTIKTKSEYILKRMWANHALDIKTICIGRKKYVSYYINGYAAYHIFNEMGNNSYIFICSSGRSNNEIYDNIIFNVRDYFATTKATAKIRNVSYYDAVECNPYLPVIVLGYDELELYN